MKTWKHQHILNYLFCLTLMGAGGMAHGVEEPRYTVIGNIGAVEIRQYQAVIQAKTILPDSGHTSAGFRRLAGFIFGGNSGAQKIAMTAPVQETLAVGQTELAFTMPEDYRMENLPRPNDKSVTLVEIPARTVAVIEFSGWASAGKVRRYQKQLLQIVESGDMDVAGPPMLNQYNPPWTPPFLRRNEIMLEIEESAFHAKQNWIAKQFDAETFRF